MLCYVSLLFGQLGGGLFGNKMQPGLGQGGLGGGLGGLSGGTAGLGLGGEWMNSRYMIACWCLGNALRNTVHDMFWLYSVSSPGL